MVSSGASAERLVPDCRILLDGKQLSMRLNAELTRVEVDLDLDLIDRHPSRFGESAPRNCICLELPWK